MKIINSNLLWIKYLISTFNILKRRSKSKYNIKYKQEINKVVGKFNISVFEKADVEGEIKRKSNAVPNGEEDNETFPLDSPWMVLFHNPCLLTAPVIRLLKHFLLTWDIITRVKF